jgi:hypothetical protein
MEFEAVSFAISHGGCIIRRLCHGSTITSQQVILDQDLATLLNLATLKVAGLGKISLPMQYLLNIDASSLCSVID